MANGFGSLWVGVSGLQSASNALNTTANNITNVNSEGYVRQQVVFEDIQYSWIGTASISEQYAGLGVGVGEVIHARDIFLDKAYRTESGRQAFYEASYQAVEEVETLLQEQDGEAFQGAVADLYEAFAEFAKDPSDTVNQNLILQKSSLFLSRSKAVYSGFQDYQKIINTKIKDDVDRINAIGKELKTLNHEIQRIESANVETAMDLRDTRDLLLDELSGLCRISYSERPDGIVKVEIEGTQFLDEGSLYQIDIVEDLRTGFVTPIWPQLSDMKNEDYYHVFSMDNISAAQNSDVGEIKALLLARGDHFSNYSDIENVSAEAYKEGIGSSIMMNSQSELDRLVHSLVVAINNQLSPMDTAANVYKDIEFRDASGDPISYTAKGPNGETYIISESTLLADVNNCNVGSDGKIPPEELFVRRNVERYTKVTADINGQLVEMYYYNPEDLDNNSTCYTLDALEINPELVQEESLLAHKSQNGNIAYDLGAALESIWVEQNYYLNPADTTPANFQEFYTKWIGEIGTVGSVHKTTSQSLGNTIESIESNRQAVIGVSSDEELTNVIKYQNAYNASSRFINVVNEMIEYMITSMA